MTTRIIETKVYTIESHPNPEKVYEWIRNNWYDLMQFTIDDCIVSLEAFADFIGAKLDYSISAVPDRGEHITFNFEYAEMTLADIGHIDVNGDCPFSGMGWDETILDAFRDESNGKCLETILSDVEYRILKHIHDETDYIYGDEALQEMCEINEYEFTEDGECV